MSDESEQPDVENVAKIKIKELLNDEINYDSSRFSLAEHQKEPLDKIVKFCKYQKGLLLWHTMGSGKTITAWNIAMNFPLKDVNGNEHKRIILGPKGLDISWKNDAKNIMKIIGEASDKKALYTNLHDRSKSESLTPTKRNLGRRNPSLVQGVKTR